jgi:hypothetical protein
MAVASIFRDIDSLRVKSQWSVREGSNIIGGAYPPRARLRNSSRVRGSSRIVSLDPVVLMPRKVMQLCSSSITTSTPCG